MPAATVTTKGQITIPKEVRGALRVGAGDRVSFLVREDGVVELRPETVDLKQLIGVFKRKGRPVSVKDMNESIAAAAAESFRRSRRG